MRIAIIYDKVTKYGGAERVVEAIHEIWPNAPLFTLVSRSDTGKWASLYKINTSFIQRIPFGKKYPELLSFMSPYAVEAYHFDSYDVVLTITSSDFKGIITSPKTLHICYCLTPTRYLWSGYHIYQDEPGIGLLNRFARVVMKALSVPMRYGDFISSQRPDNYIAISHTVAKRINYYYRRNCDILYPPVDLNVFRLPKKTKKGLYYLVVSRLVPYKKVDFVIKACNKLKLPLCVIGDGIDEKRLKKLAGTSIQFVRSDLTDEKLCWYYQNCLALIYPSEEDFGLSAVEALACGKPVIGYARGGIGEIVQEGVNGLVYADQTPEVLEQTLQRFNGLIFSEHKCRDSVQKYSKKQFQSSLKRLIQNIIMKRKTL